MKYSFYADLLLIRQMSAPFSTSFHLIIFMIIFSLWCVSLLLERLIMRKENINIIKARGDKGTYFLVYLTVLFSVIISFVLGFNGLLRLPTIVSYIGILCILSGTILREFSILTLDQYFSFQISIVEDHRVVDSGPYHLIRHPAYTGIILSLLGISLALSSMVAVLVVIVICTIAFGLRIEFEEKLMLEEFGDDYLDYKSRTKKLIPFIY